MSAFRDDEALSRKMSKINAVSRHIDDRQRSGDSTARRLVPIRRLSMRTVN